MGLCLPTITPRPHLLIKMTFLSKKEDCKINTALIEGYGFSGTYHFAYGYFLYVPQEFSKTELQL